MGIEYELKYRASEAALEAIRQAFPGQTQLFSMQTTYYDTPSGALSARWYTLRLRMENEVSVCTLKAPAPGIGRGEWELPCDSIEAAIPELCKLGAPNDLPALAAEGLIRVCGARFQRTAITLPLPEATVELALDLGTLHGGSRQIPLCEVEVELKAGKPEACAAFGGMLAAKFGLQPETKSKFRRALALYKGE